jgi:nicotinate-nucleotide--dimethylbenzimidazole phosphoribosyltransferase
MVGQFMAGRAAVNVLARQMGARLTVVDAGVDADLAHPSNAHARFVAGKIARGTGDLSLGPAMTSEQAAASLALGARVASEEIASGANILIVGEMGIGNTTSASALIAAITSAPAADVTGRGTGLDDAGLARKIALIESALADAPADADPLAQFGGFEIGAMAGAMLTAASARVPVILDGLICTAAALVAARIDPAVTATFIAGHRSAEPGHARALDHLGLHPLLELDMRLGEGTGALLALPLVEAAARLTQEMGALDVGLAG